MLQRVTFLTFAIFSIFVFTGQVQAQSYTGIGYTANVPDQPIGFDIRGVNVEEASLFLQIKTSPFPPESETYDNISQDTFNDRQIDSKTVRTSISVGPTYGVTENFHVWGGAGVTIQSKYAELQDPTDILGSRDGQYWVQTQGETAKLKVLGGVGTNFNSTHWYGLLGGEYNPTGVNLAIGFRW